MRCRRTFGVELGIRRYGFHGLAHQAMWERWRELEPRLPGGGKLITLQLGGGCSIAALDQGRPRDTSMGFSPLEGLVMETRSGDIDAAVVPYLERRLGVSGERVIEMLNERSGLAGVAGSADDPQALLETGSAQAQFAVELYCYRARKYLGAYLAVLGGCDGIAFGGGVGEHVAAGPGADPLGPRVGGHRARSSRQPGRPGQRIAHQRRPQPRERVGSAG